MKPACGTYAVVAVDTRITKREPQSNKVERPQDNNYGRIYRLRTVVRLRRRQDAHEGRPVWRLRHRREVPGGFAKKMMAPVDPSIVVLHRPQLQGSRGRDEEAAGRAAGVPQAAVVGDWHEGRVHSLVGRHPSRSEMAVVIVKTASRVSKPTMKYVWSVTCLNDVTARELQAKDVQCSAPRAGYVCAGGPCIAVGLDPPSLHVEGWVNGEQSRSRTRAN